jgi:beta-glucosidase
MYTRHKVAENNNREAVKIAIMAGIDMSMVPEDYTFYNDLLDLVAKGDQCLELMMLPFQNLKNEI